MGKVILTLKSLIENGHQSCPETDLFCAKCFTAILSAALIFTRSVKKTRSSVSTSVLVPRIFWGFCFFGHHPVLFRCQVIQGLVGTLKDWADSGTTWVRFIFILVLGISRVRLSKSISLHSARRNSTFHKRVSMSYLVARRVIRLPK